jgi:hypothetical protein
MRIKVAAGIQVVHEGERYMDGEVAEVPQHLGEKWIRFGWAAEVMEPEPKVTAAPVRRTR